MSLGFECNSNRPWTLCQQDIGWNWQHQKYANISTFCIMFTISSSMDNTVSKLWYKATFDINILRILVKLEILCEYTQVPFLRCFPEKIIFSQYGWNPDNPNKFFSNGTSLKKTSLRKPWRCGSWIWNGDLLTHSLTEEVARDAAASRKLLGILPFNPNYFQQHKVKKAHIKPVKSVYDYEGHNLKRETSFYVFRIDILMFNG